jgi:hypothetical protein
MQDLSAHAAEDRSGARGLPGSIRTSAGDRIRAIRVAAMPFVIRLKQWRPVPFQALEHYENSHS